MVRAQTLSQCGVLRPGIVELPALLAVPRAGENRIAGNTGTADKRDVDEADGILPDDEAGQHSALEAHEANLCGGEDDVRHDAAALEQHDAIPLRLHALKGGIDSGEPPRGEVRRGEVRVQEGDCVDTGGEMGPVSGG